MNNPFPLLSPFDLDIADQSLNAPESLALPPLSDAIEAWVCTGLLHFWRTALPTDTGVYSLLQARVRQCVPLANPALAQDWGLAQAEWLALFQQYQLANQPPSRQIPLLQWVDDYRVSQPALYAVALLGMVETSHLVNLAIAELQAPDHAPRPCVHLVCALVNSLFGSLEAPSDPLQDPLHNPFTPYDPFTPWDFSEQPWVKERWVTLVGDVPLPLQRAQINPLLWALLMGRRVQWPQTSPVSPSALAEQALGAEAAESIPVVAGLLRNSFEASPSEISSTPLAGVVVRGNPNSGRGLFCCQLAQALGLQALEVPLELWRDNPLFLLACRYARWLPVVRPTIAPGDTLRLPPAFSHSSASIHAVPVVFILGTEGTVDLGNMLELEIDTPKQSERYACWYAALADLAPYDDVQSNDDQINGEQDDKQHHDREQLARLLAASARLSVQSIQRVAQHAQHIAQASQQSLGLPHIAEARRRLGVEKLRLVAQPVFRHVDAKALVLPPLVHESLDALVMRACKRESLWENLGETLKVTPNPGVRALFVGESGTGKTLAASYIATRLGAPLYRVDLSAVMNKYIGESEKNLAQLLDQAAACDVVLLFDEADALFGSRSDGKENGERFANMLTNFLLTRIETHPGIVILTTNSRERIDTAFTRRLDAIVEFPQPGFEERLHLWQSHLGERGAGDALYRSLASYCDLAGGQVRNVVLTAAAYAEGPAITVANLLEGLRAEYRKQGREMPKKLEALSLME